MTRGAFRPDPALGLRGVGDGSTLGRRPLSFFPGPPDSYPRSGDPLSRVTRQATTTVVTTRVAAMATCTAMTVHGSPCRYWYSPTPAWQIVRATPATERRCASEPR